MDKDKGRRFFKIKRTVQENTNMLASEFFGNIPQFQVRRDFLN
jgi:hypothetical protein